MNLELIISAIVQGVSEFIPISSTAHLKVFNSLLGVLPLSTGIIVALHGGSMLAICAYFYHEIIDIINKFIIAFKDKTFGDAKRAFNIVIATIPTVIVGYLITKYLGEQPDTPILIGINSIIFGSLLYISDINGSRVKSIKDMKYSEAFIIGLMQVLALIPGASRSGVTLTALRFLGFSRTESVKFSFLMAIPVILGGIIIKSPHIIKETTFSLSHILLGMFLCLIVGIFTIKFMMTYLKNGTFKWFVIYRIIFGIILIYLNW